MMNKFVLNKFVKKNFLFGLAACLTLGSLAGSAHAQDFAIQRADTLSAGNVTQIAADRAREGVVVTAVRDGNGNLRLISWQVGSNGSMTRRDTEVAGAVSEIVSTQARNGFIVTSVRDGDGNLRLISWEVASNGAITRRDTEVAGAVSEIAAARRLDPSSISDQFIVTAVRDGSNNLRVISWSIDVNGELTRLDTEAAGAVTTIAAAGYDDGVVTAVRDGNNNLRLISWDVANDGDLTRRDTETAGAVSTISMAAVGPGVVTSVRDGGNNLRVISWDVSGTGRITRRDTEVAGAVSRIASAQVRLAGGLLNDRVVTAVRDGSNNLRVIGWNVDNSNAGVERAGTAVAGTVSNIAVAKASNDVAVTAVRDGSNNLRLISWRLETE